MTPELKPVKIDSDKIVFDAIKRKSVVYVPQYMIKVAKKIAKDLGKQIDLSRTGGNDSYTWFYFNESLSYEEYENVDNI